MDVIKETASTLIRFSGVTAPPVDPFSLAEQLGVKIFTEYFTDGLQGILIIENNLAVIGIDADDRYPGRRRFTVSHELGHFLLPEHKGRSYQCTADDIWRYQSDKKLETEANAFAAELLMPEAWILPYLRRNPFSLDLIKQVAEVFDVSLTSAAIRLVKLSPDPAALVMSRNTKILWIWRSTNFRGYINTAHGLNQSTYTMDCYENGLSREVSGTLPAHYWLSDTRYEYVTESCVPMAALNQVLTVLTIPFDEDFDELEDEQMYFDSWR